MMLDTKMPCFKGQTVESLINRLKPTRPCGELAETMLEVIRSSTLNGWTRLYDLYQYQQNGVEYW